MSAVFEATDLRRDYDGVAALALPSLRIDEGELVVLTGRNGSGKSTLLRLLAHLEPPTSGTLTYRGADPRREISLLLQEPYLLRMSVFDNVTLGLRLQGRTDGMAERYVRSMELVGFRDALAMRRRSPRALSGGERQRVALAARLALRPRVLLLDEPTAHVDAGSERVIVDGIGSCLRSGTTVVCATHDVRPFGGLGAREIVLTPAGSAPPRRAADDAGP